MTNKYRIFYDLHYKSDVLDYTEDIRARTDSEAVRKAKKFIEAKNNERKEETRRTCIQNGLREAESFSEEQLLTGNYFVLTGVSLVTETLTTIEIKKEDLKAVSIS